MIRWLIHQATKGDKIHKQRNGKAKRRVPGFTTSRITAVPAPINGDTHIDRKNTARSLRAAASASPDVLHSNRFLCEMITRYRLRTAALVLMSASYGRNVSPSMNCIILRMKDFAEYFRCSERVISLDLLERSLAV